MPFILLKSHCATTTQSLGFPIISQYVVVGFVGQPCKSPVQLCWAMINLCNAHSVLIDHRVKVGLNQVGLILVAMRKA